MFINSCYFLWLYYFLRPLYFTVLLIYIPCYLLGMFNSLFRSKSMFLFRAGFEYISSLSLYLLWHFFLSHLIKTYWPSAFDLFFSSYITIIHRFGPFIVSKISFIAALLNWRLHFPLSGNTWHYIVMFLVMILKEAAGALGIQWPAVSYAVKHPLYWEKSISSVLTVRKPELLLVGLSNLGLETRTMGRVGKWFQVGKYGLSTHVSTVDPGQSTVGTVVK